jgi:chromosomal replication initiator protein
MNRSRENYVDNSLISSSRPTPSVVLENIAEEYGVSVEEITGPRRSPYIYNARIAAIRDLKSIGMSSVEIGRLLNRDHTTILHALKRP